MLLNMSPLLNAFKFFVHGVSVRLPVIVRYIDEIVKYVETIIEHGFAYAVHGSVYFDTKAFRWGKKWGKRERGMSVVQLHEGVALRWSRNTVREEHYLLVDECATHLL